MERASLIVHVQTGQMMKDMAIHMLAFVSMMLWCLVETILEENKFVTGTMVLAICK